MGAHVSAAGRGGKCPGERPENRSQSLCDRHCNLGQGELGWEPFRFIMNDPRLENIPLILETTDEKLWSEEIRTLYGLNE